MDIPIYDENDLKYADQDGDINISEFADFFSQLEENEILDNPTEKGVVALVNSKGTKVLSSKQLNVLKIIVSRYENEECKLCGERIPLNEVLHFYDEYDGFCSYHKHIFDKEND